MEPTYPDWVASAERLPPCDVPVITWYERAGLCLAYRAIDGDADVWVINGESGVSFESAPVVWMPLPSVKKT
jgi:hypothetical protein